MVWKRVLCRCLPALLIIGAASAASPADGGKKVLYFTKSAGFEHSVVKRNAGEDLAWSEKILVELGKKHGYEIICSRDGAMLAPAKLKEYAAVISYATGDWTNPGKDKKTGKPITDPVPQENVDALIEAVANGMGFVGVHAGNDSFRVGKGKKPSPYIAMLGGEFSGHGKQQTAWNLVASPNFPGMKEIGPAFGLHEEWYAATNLADDLHVILIQQTAGMEGNDYQIPPFPATWARMHGKGRVYYTSLGHREDVWTNPMV